MQPAESLSKWQFSLFWDALSSEKVGEWIKRSKELFKYLVGVTVECIIATKASVSIARRYALSEPVNSVLVKHCSELSIIEHVVSFCNSEKLLFGILRRVTRRVGLN